MWDLKSTFFLVLKISLIKMAYHLGGSNGLFQYFKFAIILFLVRKVKRFLFLSQMRLMLSDPILLQ